MYDFQVYEFSKWNKRNYFCTFTDNLINNKCSLAIFKKKFTFFFAERYFFFDTNVEDIFMANCDYFDGTVAQWIEQRPSKPKVEGSTPSCPAIKINKFGSAYENVVGYRFIQYTKVDFLRNATATKKELQ